MTMSSQADFAFHALAVALPSGAAPPEWITIFPKSGRIETRDGRTFDVDPTVLVARFAADGVAVPIDVNHATHHASKTGARADAVGWISELRVEGGALQGKVEWLAEGEQLVAAKRYRFVSPDFFHTPEGRPTWLRSVALVTAPALGGQKALAAASSESSEESKTMKDLAAALGATAEASENALLAALAANYVPKKVHDQALSQLNAATTKLTTIEAEARKARVDALVEGALKDKKILPAEKDHYVSLCSTDAGLEAVAQLLAAKVVQLPASGLDVRTAPGGDAGETLTPAQLAAKANKMVADGEASDFLAAVGALQSKHFATA